MLFCAYLNREVLTAGVSSQSFIVKVAPLHKMSTVFRHLTSKTANIYAVSISLFPWFRLQSLKKLSARFQVVIFFHSRRIHSQNIFQDF